MTQLWLQSSATLQPWEVDARFPFHRGMSALLGDLPGCRREEPKPGTFGVKRWVIPEDLLPLVFNGARELGVGVLDQRRTPNLRGAPPLPNLSPRFPQQLDAAQAAAVAPAYLLNFSMGLGKTWSAVTAARLRGSRKFIIIAPAMAREVWGREIQKWWPQEAHTVDAGAGAAATTTGASAVEDPARMPAVGLPRPSIKIVRDSAQSVRGRKRLRTDTPDGQALAAFVESNQSWALVLSYGLLHVLQPLLEAGALVPDGIICDEIHYLQNPKAQRTAAVFALRDAFPKAWRLGLTGTVVTNNVDSMWCPLDWLFPERFGKLKQFQWRYMNPVPKISAQTGELFGYDYKPKAPVDGGLRTAAELASSHDELRERMTHFSMRVTKKDVAHLLPPFSVQQLDVKDPIREAVELVQDAMAGDATHVRVMCYLHATADRLRDTFERAFPDVPVTKIDGRENAQQRDAAIEKAKAQLSSILVATISSTQVAIDLTDYTTALYVELSPKLVENIQSLGRGHRLSSTKPATVLVLTDAKGDRRARLMADKVEALNGIIKAGTEEGGLQDALGRLRDAEMSDADFAEVTAAVLGNFFDDLGEG